MENGQILLYFHFNKIIKELGTSFQSPALIQKHIRNICQTAHQYLTKFHFDSAQDSNETRISVTFLIQQIFKSVDFTETQKSGHLQNETFFLQKKKKKSINYTLRATLLQKIVLQCSQPLNITCSNNNFQWLLPYKISLKIH